MLDSVQLQMLRLPKNCGWPEKREPTAFSGPAHDRDGDNQTVERWGEKDDEKMGR